MGFENQFIAGEARIGLDAEVPGSRLQTGTQLMRNLDGYSIEWASARVPPTPLLGGWAEGGWSISNPVTSQILA